MKLGIKKSKFAEVGNIKIPAIFYNRYKTGDSKIDGMFGNGILPGCAFTVTAQAGTGKTTMMLQICEALEKNGLRAGYASGEEDVTQLAFTCQRLNIKKVRVANETDVDELALAMEDLNILVIDSFQALSVNKDVHGNMNTRAKEEYITSTLIGKAKQTECAIFFIMHLTKDGKLKGSTLVPHSVDVNLQLLHDAEQSEQARIISFYKNRFGATKDFPADMTANGLIFSDSSYVAPPKVSKQDKRKAEILKMDPPNITQKRVASVLNVSSSVAYVVLKELETEGKLKKFGRGSTAVFKKVRG